jgi:hypothetical protein
MARISLNRLREVYQEQQVFKEPEISPTITEDFYIVLKDGKMLKPSKTLHFVLIEKNSDSECYYDNSGGYVRRHYIPYGTDKTEQKEYKISHYPLMLDFAYKSGLQTASMIGLTTVCGTNKMEDIFELIPIQNVQSYRSLRVGAYTVSTPNE